MLYSFSKCLTSSYYLPGTVVDAGKAAVNQSSCPGRTVILGRGACSKQTRQIGNRRYGRSSASKNSREEQGQLFQGRLRGRSDSWSGAPGPLPLIKSQQHLKISFVESKMLSINSEL